MTDESLSILLIIFGSFSFVFFLVFIVIFVAKKRVGNFLVNLVAKLNLEKFERPALFYSKKKIAWYKGCYHDREYWLTFTKGSEFSPIQHHNQSISILTLLLETKSKDHERLFNYLTSIFNLQKKDPINNVIAQKAVIQAAAFISDKSKEQIDSEVKTNLEKCRNNFYSDKIILGLYDTMYTKEPLPPFQAKGKYVIKMYLNKVPNNEPQDIIDILDKIIAADRY